MKSKIIAISILMFCISTIAFTQKVLQKNLGHIAIVKCLVYSPDGKYIATSSESVIKLWSVESARELRTFIGHSEGVTVLKFTPNGKQLLSCSTDKTAKLWDIETGKDVRTFNGHQAWITGMDISRDGKILATASWDKTIKLWDIASGANLITINGHTAEVKDVAFNPGGDQIISVSADNTMRLWDVKTGKLDRTYSNPNENLFHVTLSPDGGSIATNAMGSIETWNKLTGIKTNTYVKYNSYTKPIFSNDGNYIAFESKGRVNVWNTKTKERFLLFDEEIGSSGYDFSPDGKHIATASTSASVKIWDLYDGELVKSFGSYINPVRNIALSPAGENKPANKYLVFANNDGYIKIWDFEALRVKYSFEAKSQNVTIMHFNHNGKYLVYGNSKGDIVLLDVEAAKVKRYLTGHKHPITTIALSPVNSKGVDLEERMVTGDSEGNAFVWDLQTGKMVASKRILPTLKKLYFVDNGRNIMAFNGAFLKKLTHNLERTIKELSGNYDDMIVRGKDTIYIHHWYSFYKVRENTNDGYSIKCYDKSNQTIDDPLGSKYFAVASGDMFLSTSGNIRLYETQTQKLVRTIDNDYKNVTSIRFNPDNKIIITGDVEGSIKFYNTQTGELIATLLTSTKADEWLIITPDGYWDGSPRCSELISMVEGLNLWSIDQFAIKHNRPDIVLQRLSPESTSYIKHYRAQFNKRLRKHKLTENEIETGFHTPVAKISNSKQDSKFVDLSLQFSDSKYSLVSYNIYVNDVPLFGIGKKIDPKSSVITDRVELTAGLNKIEVSCINQKGTESFRDVVYYRYKIQNPANLYFIGFGVSDYKNSELNLKYAHQDASDLAKTFESMKGKGFENVFTKVFVNKEVTTKNIVAVKDFLSNAKPDDAFVLFIAGHGMHDKDETYYYLTHEADLNNLAGTAANFELIEDLLQGIAPRNKLFLMDACESGEVDDEESATILVDASSRGLRSRGFKMAATPEKPIHIATTRKFYAERNRFIYNDLMRRSGAIVFSSSKGNEFSYELDEFQNGLFTEFIIKAFNSKEADNDNNNIISTSELRSYVTTEVSKFSAGAQNPTVDRDNIYLNFGFHYFIPNRGHIGAVADAVFSPKGDYIISAGVDKTIKTWDIKLGKVLRNFEGHTDKINAVAVSPDGEYIASCSDDWTIRVWNTRTGQNTKTVKVDHVTATGVCFSLDGKSLVTSHSDRTINVWEIETGRILNTIKTDFWISKISLSPDGKLLLAGGSFYTSDGLGLYNLTNGKKVQSYEIDKRSVQSVAFSPDGKYIAAGFKDGYAAIWDIKKKANIKSFEFGQYNDINGLAFAIDGKSLAIGSRTSIKIIDVISGEEIKSIYGREKEGKGKYNEAEHLSMYYTIIEHDRPINVLRFSPDGSLIISGSFDSTLKLWDVNEGNGIKTLSGDM